MTTSAATSKSLSFIDHRKVEFAMAAHLNRMRDIALKLALHETAAQINEVLRSIENHSFSIAIVGEFKRGKSTFINALLGKEILPADIAPTSATLNRVTYGIRPQVQLIFRATDTQPERVEEIAIDQLNDYVTKLTPEAEAMAAKVKEAIVYYPIPYCQNNVSIIDTPGLNDNAAMTAVTMAVLPQVDAAIMVIMPESPFAGSEGAFLNSLLANDLGHVMFVVTAIDRVRRAADRDRVLQRISERIKTALARRAAEQFGEQSENYQRYMQRVGEPKVFGVSGYDALQGKIANNAELLLSSGFTSFETALEKFLTEQRGAVELKVVADRVSAQGEKLINALVAQQTVFEHERQKLAQAVQVLTRGWEAIAAQIAGELQAIDSAAKQAHDRVGARLELLFTEMSSAAPPYVLAAPLTVEELNRASVGAMQKGSQRFFNTVMNRLPDNIKDASKGMWDKAADKLKAPVITAMAENVGQAMHTTCNSMFENIVVIVRYELGREIKRLSTFAAVISAFLKAAEPLLTSTHGISAVERQPLMTSMSIVSAATSAQMRMHDYYTNGLRELVATINSDLDLVTLAFNQSTRALLAVGQARSILNAAERIHLFKTSYTTALSEELEKQRTLHHIDQQIGYLIETAFGQLKQNMQWIVKDIAEQLQPLQQELIDAQDRRLVLIERDQAACGEMRGEVVQIVEQASQLSAQLVELIGV